MVVSTNQGLLSKNPPWKDDLNLALKKGQRTTARYLSLATLGSGSPDAPDPLAPVPRVRTVVFRGWLWSTTCALTFITDARSDKMAHMGACDCTRYYQWQQCAGVARAKRFRSIGRIHIFTTEKSTIPIRP